MSEPTTVTSQSHAQLIWQPGVVADKSGDEYCVEMDTPQHCQRCLDGQGCGAGVFSQLFAKKGARLMVSSIEPLNIGDRVQVGVSPQGILKASVALYAWPLALFLLTLVVVGPLWLKLGLWGGEWGVLVVALAVPAFGIKALAQLRFQAVNPTVVPLSCSKTDPALDR